jgi:3-oxoadipate CoA-transferase, beta subunit
MNSASPANRRPGGLRPWSLEEVARHIAVDLPAAACVNIGIGLPTLVPGQIPADKELILHSENGMLGVGPPPEPGEEDPELIDAGKNRVTLVPGGSYFSHAEAFVMIRGGHIDVTVLGAFQVSQAGDLANWAVPGEKLPAVGGAMDLAAGAKAVVVITRHTTHNGQPKLVARCTYPLTARRVVRRVYTDLATLDINDGRFVVLDAAPGVEPGYLSQVTGGHLEWPNSSAAIPVVGVHAGDRFRADAVSAAAGRSGEPDATDGRHV